MNFEEKALVTGLTGMSGAGKTTACGVFRENGFAVIDCDRTARSVVGSGRPALAEITGRFGEEYINADGTLDRRRLGALVFSSEADRIALNDIIYPYILYEIITDIIKCTESGCRYILLDAPTLFESGADSLCGPVVSVVADIDRCAERIEKRDGITRKQALDRLSSQHGAQFYRERSQFCIVNDGSEDELRNRSLEIIKALKEREGDVT